MLVRPHAPSCCRSMKTARFKRLTAWTFHFTPTSASWLNAVEGFFATLTKRRLKRGVFRSVADLQAAINRFLSGMADEEVVVDRIQARPVRERANAGGQIDADRLQREFFLGSRSGRRQDNARDNHDRQDRVQ
jgi:hypothetical protein